MKVQIKTAHGFLSAQPPLGNDPNGQATLQYRPTAGAWEEFELIGWDMQQVPPGGVPPVTDDVPDSVEPVEQTAAFIERVKQWLLGNGENLSGPCGAFMIVEHAAWWLHFTFPAVGLLDKPGGNNCRSYATDVLIAQGHIVDILTDAGGINGPTWAPEDVPADMTRWRPPYDPTTVTSAAMRTASEMEDVPRATQTPARKKK